MLFDSKILAAASAAPVAVANVPRGLGDDAWFQASSALTGEAVVPGMVRPFLGHQGAAFNFSLDSIARWGGAFLGDDMGMGKTQVMLALIAHTLAGTNGYAIMVAPPVAIAGYRSDLAEAFPHLRFVQLKGRKVFTPEAADIYFLSDDSLTMKAWLSETTAPDSKGKTHLVASPFAAAAAIFTRDEIHRDKGNQGKPTGRAKVTLAVAASLRAQVKPIVVATGTLLTNRPIEALIPLTVVGGDDLVTALTPGASKASSFKFRYCNPTGQARAQGGFGVSFNGTDLDEMLNLHEYLRRTVYVRREKSALGNALPHSGWIVKPIALPNESMVTYNRIEREFLRVIMEEKGEAAMLRAANAETVTKLQRLWEEAAMAKVDAAVDYIADLVDQGKQVIAFYIHTNAYHAMVQGLLNLGITIAAINGSNSGVKRVKDIAEFQAGNTQVMLAQIKAAGMAVTLTAAADAVFVQVPWSAGDLKQAADRILRVDQISRDRAARGEGITWHVLQACREDGSTTFDAAIWSALENKAKVCDAVNAGMPITMHDDNVLQAAIDNWYPQARAAHGFSKGWASKG